MSDRNLNQGGVISSSGSKPEPGPFLATVVSHQDGTYMGILEVELDRPTGGTSKEGELHRVNYMSPFGGITSKEFVAEDPNDYNNTQKSYGFWMVPPDVGSKVIVFFINGDPKYGYWIGCVFEENKNFMIPGLAATEYVLDSKQRRPVAEFNAKVNTATSDPSKFKKPAHPFAAVLENQGNLGLNDGGLLYDDTRGITTSSARRETPSMVFGISTPGPLDKRSGAKTGPIGKEEHKIPNAFVSRLGGSTFVMDDGDDKFLRKKKPSEAGPEYMAIEQGETGGDVTIPHNELVRIRTRTGHQILLHNSEDLIYITNSRGTAWIEMTSNGKIDVYASDSISFRSDVDINFSAARDINLHAGSDTKDKTVGKFTADTDGWVNITARRNVKITATFGDLEVLADAGSGKITVKNDLNLKSSHHIETAGKIDMNGPAAAVATKAYIPIRVPTQEPYSGHENLDPTKVIPVQTKASDPSASRSNAIPDFFKKYTTKTDTFAKVKGEEKKK